MGKILQGRGRWMNCTRPLWVWICGGGMWLTVSLTRLTVGSPYAVCHVAESVIPLPPLWLCGLWWQGTAFLAGCAWGYVMGLRRRGAQREVWIFQGSTCMVLAVVGAMLWYVRLFGAMAPLSSFLALLGALGFGVAAEIFWWRVCRRAAVLLGAWLLWLCCLLLIQLVVMLHI